MVGLFDADLPMVLSPSKKSPTKTNLRVAESTKQKVTPKVEHSLREGTDLNEQNILECRVLMGS